MEIRFTASPDTIPPGFAAYPIIPRRPAKRSAWASFGYWVRVWYYRYEVTTATYIMTPWEKVVFNTIFLTLVALGIVAAFSVPRMLAGLYIRAMYYLEGPVTAMSASTLLTAKVALNTVAATAQNATATIRHL